MMLELLPYVALMLGCVFVTVVLAIVSGGTR